MKNADRHSDERKGAAAITGGSPLPVWKAKGGWKNMYVLLYLLWILLNGGSRLKFWRWESRWQGWYTASGIWPWVTVCPGTCFLKAGSYSCIPGHGGLGGGEGQCGHYPHSAVPHMEITPCLVPVKTDLKSAGARAALANAVP